MTKPKRTSILNYAFANGKIRALERFLIKQEVLEEAIESDLAGALRLFVESDLYNEELLHIQDSQQLEAVLEQELLKLKKLLQDLLLDKELFCLIELNNLKDAQAKLKAYGSEFLNDYISYLIDMHNIKSFLRLYVVQEPQEKLKENLTCDGFIKKEIFLALYEQDLSAFLHRLEYVHRHNRTINYAAYLNLGIQKLVTENSFIYLEKAINDFLIQALRPARYLTFGPQPLLAYYFAKSNEINLLRMIILAKLNDLSADFVKERLNAVYA